jgi:hypothetical protein
MKRREQALPLLRKAAQDEAPLDEVLTSDQVSDEIIGFHCQQAGCVTCSYWSVRSRSLLSTKVRNSRIMRQTLRGNPLWCLAPELLPVPAHAFQVKFDAFLFAPCEILAATLQTIMALSR